MLCQSCRLFFDKNCFAEKHFACNFQLSIFNGQSSMLNKKTGGAAFCQETPPPQTTFKKLTLLSHIDYECIYIQFMMTQLRACNLFWVQSYCKIMIPATTFFASVDTP